MMGSKAHNALVIVAIIAALAIGMIVGQYTTQPKENGIIVQGSEYIGFNEEDKNFLATLANSQIDLTAVKSAVQNDWCVSNGGIWNESAQEGELQVSEQTAQALREASVSIREQDGNFFASVFLVQRNGCIIPRS